MISTKQIDEFIAEHRLPIEFAGLITKYYIPLAKWILRQKRENETLLVGINGAQGTGKSTLAALLKTALKSEADWQVAILSIDDFYLTIEERKQLAGKVHPLLRTRGVPGTHDVEMLIGCIDKLVNLDAESTSRLPRFEKAKDDRADSSDWPVVSGPVDLVIVEGWCVGSPPQQESELIEPTNALEEFDDAHGKWRKFVNDSLRGEYATLFARLNALIFLQAPGFSVIHRWRLLQEEKLTSSKPADSSGIMSSQQIARFIQHYERVTRNNLAVLPALADVVLEFNDSHNCVSSHYKRESSRLSDQS
jgi:D-glycerate 3-kinase